MAGADVVRFKSRHTRAAVQTRYDQAWAVIASTVPAILEAEIAKCNRLLRDQRNNPDAQELVVERAAVCQDLKATIQQGVEQGFQKRAILDTWIELGNVYKETCLEIKDSTAKEEYNFVSDSEFIDKLSENFAKTRLGNPTAYDAAKANKGGSILTDLRQHCRLLRREKRTFFSANRARKNHKIEALDQLIDLIVSGGGEARLTLEQFEGYIAEIQQNKQYGKDFCKGFVSGVAFFRPFKSRVDCILADAKEAIKIRQQATQQRQKR